MYIYIYIVCVYYINICIHVPIQSSPLRAAHMRNSLGWLRLGWLAENMQRVSVTTRLRKKIPVFSERAPGKSYATTYEQMDF